jgi:hypothetical protein
LAVRTSSSNGRGGGAAWASLVAGVASVATIPVAVFLTRYFASYELLDSAFAIPGGALLGVLAILLSRRAQRRGALLLGRASRERIVKAGRALGIVGLCIALTALVSLAVYGLLEYAGTRD